MKLVETVCYCSYCGVWMHYSNIGVQDNGDVYVEWACPTCNHLRWTKHFINRWGDLQIVPGTNSYRIRAQRRGHREE